MFVAAVCAGVVVLVTAVLLHRRTSKKKVELKRLRAETRARHEREWNELMESKQDQRQ